MDATADWWDCAPPSCVVCYIAVAFPGIARHHCGLRFNILGRLVMKTMLIAAALMSAALTPCADAQIIPCSQRAPLAWTLSFPRTSLSGWLRSLPTYRVWGTQNMAGQYGGSTNILKMSDPKGS